MVLAMGLHRAHLWPLLLCVLPLLSAAFVPYTSHHISGRQRYSTTSSSRGVLYKPSETDAEFVDFPTPSQRTVLKKEASKRQARKELASFALSMEESRGPFSANTLQELWDLLSVNELVLLRAVSKEDKKSVFSTAARLCAELETIQTNFPVSLLSTKGHTALIFSPSLPLDHPLHVPLRTSVGQKNKWRARVKPLRDNRGQIMKPPE